MTSVEQSGSTNPGGGDDRRGDDRGRDDRGGDDRKRKRDEVKAEVTERATKKTRDEVNRRGGRGGAAARLFAQGGLRVRERTAESVRQRVADAQEDERRRTEAAEALATPFWAAFDEEPQFERTDSFYRHLEGGENPDEVTIDFFADTTVEDWLRGQPRGNFELVRADSERYGASTSFTVYFDRNRNPRRCVVGHFQGGKFVIIHVGPHQ
ncbi:hypothetical protein [Actinophytocola xanthii]|uniref:Uncharacterized protein n=1 Tax=Actinophytocola xanthii TaxID=1912961 RepID=A0A1Q8CDT5_9PSEU|nr:hypothetical protein [Actinophytocola xanthii]OLF12531.1 hypothetical protein BU204_28920 [Actinophytocola xanthii]